MTTEEVCDLLKCSNSRLDHFCKKKYQKTFLAWRKTLRINEACNMLHDEPELTIPTIGGIVGYQDRSNFRKAFLKEKGMTPTEYRDKFGGK